MSDMNVFRPVKPIQCVLKIREIAADSWWVYRHEIGQNGILKPMSRVVFFSNTRAAAEQWIELQQQEASIYLLSDN